MLRCSIYRIYGLACISALLIIGFLVLVIPTSNISMLVKVLWSCTNQSSILWLIICLVLIPLVPVVWCSDLELKPQGKLTLTVVKANDLKNMEMIGKSDPYVVVYIRPLFKVKTKVVDNNLNPVWDETFELIAEDKETQALIFEVFVLRPSLRICCLFF